MTPREKALEAAAMVDLLQKCAGEFAVIAKLCGDKHAYVNGKRISAYAAIAWHCKQAQAALAAALGGGK